MVPTLVRASRRKICNFFVMKRVDGGTTQSLHPANCDTPGLLMPRFKVPSKKEMTTSEPSHQAARVEQQNAVVAIYVLEKRRVRQRSAKPMKGLFGMSARARIRAFFRPSRHGLHLLGLRAPDGRHCPLASHLLPAAQRAVGPRFDILLPFGWIEPGLNRTFLPSAEIQYRWHKSERLTAPHRKFRLGLPYGCPRAFGSTMFSPLPVSSLRLGKP